MDRIESGFMRSVITTRVWVVLALLMTVLSVGARSNAGTDHAETGLVLSNRFDPTNQTFARFGHDLDSGDFNNDGFSDILVGVPRHHNPRQDDGSAFLYFGSEEGVRRSPLLLQPKSQRFAEFGYSVAVGDVNNDGFDDAAIGALEWDGDARDEGAVFLYMGSSLGLSDPPARRLEPTNRINDSFGSQVAMGDVNGNGFDDVIVMQPRTQNDDGTVWVYSGAPFGLRKGPSEVDPPDRPDSPYLGFDDVIFAGDVDDDGFGDLLMSSGSRAYLFFGTENGVQANAFQTIEPPDEMKGFARTLGNAGDVNSDGFDDVLISGRDAGEDYDRVYLYLGGPSGLELHPDVAVRPADGYRNFGVELGTAGDLNNDGFDDVLISDPNLSGQYHSEGITHLYLGSPEGWQFPPAETFEEQPKGDFSNFGTSVTSVADVDGDQRVDLAIGATGWSTKRVEFEGRLFIYTQP